MGVVREIAEKGLTVLSISDEASEVHLSTELVLRMAHGRIVGDQGLRPTERRHLEGSVYG